MGDRWGQGWEVYHLWVEPGWVLEESVADQARRDAIPALRCAEMGPASEGVADAVEEVERG